MEDQFHVPENYIGERVHLWLDQMIGMKNEATGQTVPMFILVGDVLLKSQTASSITVVTHGDSIYGKAGEKTIPKRKLAGVDRSNPTIETAATMPIIATGGGHRSR